MGFNSAFKVLKLLKTPGVIIVKKNPGNGRLNNLNDPNRPQCVNRHVVQSMTVIKEFFRPRKKARCFSI